MRQPVLKTTDALERLKYRGNARISESLKRAVAAALSPWSPRKLPAVEVWFEASPAYCFKDNAAAVPCGDGDAVYTWNSKGVNGYLVSQSTASFRPTLRATSGGWAVRFDGTNDRLTASGPLPVAPLSVAVRFATGLTGFGELVGWGNNAGVGSRYGVWFENGEIGSEVVNAAQVNTDVAVNDNAAHTVVQTYAGGNLSSGFAMRIDGEDVSTEQVYGDAALNNSLSGVFKIGGVPTYDADLFYTGDVAAIIVSSAIWTGNEILEVENYLSRL